MMQGGWLNSIRNHVLAQFAICSLESDTLFQSIRYQHLFNVLTEEDTEVQRKFWEKNRDVARGWPPQNMLAPRRNVNNFPRIFSGIYSTLETVF